MTWWRKTRPPVPGNAIPPDMAAPAPPARQPPAPGHHYGHVAAVTQHYRDGHLDCITKDFECGCRHYFDDTGCLAHAEPCAPGQPGEPDAIDLEYRSVCAQEKEDG
jgi:hypothetical protein